MCSLFVMMSATILASIVDVIARTNTDSIPYAAVSLTVYF